MAETVLHSGSFVDRNGDEIKITFYKRPDRPTMTVNPSSYYFGAGGGSCTVIVNYTGTLSVAKSADASWLSYTQASSTTGQKTYTVTASANAGYTSRNATITFSDRYSSVVMTITQGRNAVGIAVSPSNMQFGVSGGSQTLYVTSTNYVTFSNTPAWITITFVGYTDEDHQTWTVTAASNAGYARNATIFVEDSTGTTTFTVAQDAATSTLATFPSSFPMFSAGYSGSNTISVTYNGSLSAIAYTLGNWASMTLVSSSTSFNTYNISVYENFESESRSGYLWFSDAMSFTSVDIFQAGAFIPTTVTVTPKSAALDKAGGMRTVTVSFTGSEPSYTISQSGSWLTVSQGLLTSAGRAYTINWASAPLMTQSRQGTITWDDGNGGTDYFTAIQIPRSIVMISPSSLEYDYTGGTSLVTVTYLGYEGILVSVPASASEWLSAVLYSSSNYTRVFSVTALGPNPGGERTTDLIFTASNNMVDSIPVTQLSQTLPPATYLYADPSSFHFGSASDHSNMTVYFSGTLTSSAYGDYEGVVKWAICDRIAANTGSNTYVVNVKSNTTGVSRTAYLYFHDDGNDEDIVVTVDQDS